MFHAYFFRIGEGLNRLIELVEQDDEKGKKAAVKDVNEAYAVCFDVIKRIQSDDAPLREIELYKSFAHYHAIFLKRIVD